MNNQDVTALFTQWQQALTSQDEKIVTALYADNATLLPTVSNQVRHNHEEIEDYFVQLLANEPTVEMVEQNIRIFDEISINSGVYIFTLKGGITICARFSFVYQLITGHWKIIEHHSSEMPENLVG